MHWITRSALAFTFSLHREGIIWCWCSAGARIHRKDTLVSDKLSPLYRAMSSAHVLYVDHQGHPAPLSCSYHATASRRLSSSVDRYPPSTLTEVDSAYCPQCLSSYDVGSAVSLVNCPKPQCRRCPLCTAVTSVSTDSEESKCFYKCGYCSWTSKECGIAADLSMAKDGSLGKEQVALAAEALGAAIMERVATGDKSVKDHFQTMVDSWGKLAEEEVRLQKQRNVVVGPRRGLESDGPEGWSIDTLENSIRQKREKARSDATSTVGGVTLEKIPLDESKTKEISSLKDVTRDSLTLQTMVTAATPSPRKDLLPLPIPLRARKSRRCRAELADGRTGILVKPKFNPLDGDSSLRTGHGQWWKKDSSAIHVVPRVQVIRFGSDAERKRHAFLIKVRNPTLGVVRLRMSASDYKGEPEFNGEDRIKRLENLLVDLIEAKRISANLDDGATVGLNSTELVELEPVKDAFLELGKAVKKDPPQVEGWDAVEVLSDSKVGNGDDAISSSVRFITKDSDTAWFELVTQSFMREEEDLYSAVPVALNIQVGDGSWESSLVQPLPVEGDEKDYVNIDLVMAWKNGS